MFSLFPKLSGPPHSLPGANHLRIEWPATLRDEFAMAILPAVLTAYKDHCREECLKGGKGSIHQIAADIAYAYADAMLERREK